MEQWFVTGPEVYSPRWREAFPCARVQSFAQLDGAEAGGIYWLLLADETWPAQLQQLAPRGAVVAMTLSEQVSEARKALALGAVGYVHALATADVLRRVSDVVARGGLWLGADLMRQLVVGSAGAIASPVAGVDLSGLTGKEQQVVSAVAQGKTNKEIGHQLSITERTVKTHLGHIFRKLGVRDRLQLALLLTGSTAGRQKVTGQL